MKKKYRRNICGLFAIWLRTQMGYDIWLDVIPTKSITLACGSDQLVLACIIIPDLVQHWHSHVFILNDLKLYVAEWNYIKTFERNSHSIPQIIIVTSYWARWRLISPASRLFTQSVSKALIKENIKTQRHWPLWRESTGDRRIPLTKSQ